MLKAGLTAGLFCAGESETNKRKTGKKDLFIALVSQFRATSVFLLVIGTSSFDGMLASKTMWKNPIIISSQL